MTARDRWNDKTEEEKINNCLQYALNAMQASLLINENKELLNEYCELLRAQIDWISVKLNSYPMPLYYGPGRNNAKDFNNETPLFSGKHPCEGEHFIGTSGEEIEKCSQHIVSQDGKKETWILTADAEYEDKK